MRRAALLPLAIVVAALGPPGAGAQAGHAGPGDVPIYGIWRNPMGTVDVRIEACGDRLCGKVARASAEALADARDSGYPGLIGLELIQDYRAERPGRWVGTVLVPDLGHSFSSHIDLIDPNHARIAGCLWRQVFCKSQVWRRL